MVTTQLDRDTAAHVRGLLEETFGGHYDGFERYFTEPHPFACHEWRFQGSLGFGGKLYLSLGRLHVSCYPEYRTPERDALIERVNRRLEELTG